MTRDVKIDPDAARELVDALGGDMMMVSNELEKLILYVGEKKRVTLGDVETMVLAAMLTPRKCPVEINPPKRHFVPVRRALWRQVREEEPSCE